MTVKKKIASMPFRASEVFVKWAEFAAEHGDLSELNLAGADMNTFVYHSLDVIVLVVVTVLIALVGSLAALRCIVNRCIMRYRTCTDRETGLARKKIQ